MNVLHGIETPPLISVWLQVGCEQCVIENAEACEAAVNTVQQMDLHMYPKVESECGQDQTFGTYLTVQHINIGPNVKFCHEHRETLRTEKINRGSIGYRSVQNVQVLCLARPCALRKEYIKCQLGYC